jgi:protein-tyrosine phosphatase
MTLTTLNRFVPLGGSINFRDFGGYQGRDGRRVRWQRLFRCGSLSMLEASSYDAFSGLNIATICDLRRVDEAARSPTPEHPLFQGRRQIPIAPGSNDRLRTSLADKSRSVADLIGCMTELTRELARDHGDDYRLLMQHLLETKQGFLLHCSAGKDRTGFGAALILGALGVDRPSIMADYLLTNQAQCLRQYMAAGLRDGNDGHIDDESLEAVMGVREAYLDAALDEVDRRFGSMDRYLDAIGVDRGQRLELEARLLEPG